MTLQHIRVTIADPRTAGQPDDTIVFYRSHPEDAYPQESSELSSDDDRACLIAWNLLTANERLPDMFFSFDGGWKLHVLRYDQTLKGWKDRNAWHVVLMAVATTSRKQRIADVRRAMLDDKNRQQALGSDPLSKKDAQEAMYRLV